MSEAKTADLTQGDRRPTHDKLLQEINEMMKASIAAMVIALCSVIIERLQGRLNERFKEIEDRLEELERATAMKLKRAKAKTHCLTVPAHPSFAK